MPWTLLGSDLPDPISVDDNGASITVDGSVTATPPFLELTGSATANAVNLIGPVDVSAYRTWMLQLSGSGTWTIQVQGSNDGVTYYQLTGIQPTTTSPSPTTSFNTSTLYYGPVTSRYIRVRTTTYSSGTPTATLELSANPAAYPTTYISGGTTSISVGTGLSVRWDGATFGATDGQANSLGSAGSPIASYPFGYAGKVGGFDAWDRVRVPNIFKTVTATASGNTAVWTPASGRKFRIMRYRIEVTNNSTQSSAGTFDVKFQDATTDMAVASSLYVPAAIDAGMGSYDSGWVDLGNGILSAAANNVLNVNLSAALTAGKVRVVVCGTEE